MFARFGAWWSSIPKPLRDFAEGAIAAAVAGAAGAVYGLNLDTASPKAVIYFATTAALAAVIAYTRRSLAPKA